MERIINLKGGAGNQLFQYAYAKSFQLIKGDKIILNRQEFSGNSMANARFPRELFLTKLNIDLALQDVRIKAPLIERIRRKISNDYNVIYKERMSAFSNNNKSYLDGYWQSPYYFASVLHLFSSDFSVQRKFLTDNYYEALSNIDSKTICVHVRRGDYSEASLVKEYGLCSEEYFVTAIERFRYENNGGKVVVFTDQYEKAAPLFDTVEDVSFASNWDLTLEEEFELMRQFSYFIISNSTFSWWPAYLETFNNLRKKCIAPYPWFNNSSLYCDSIYPPNWLKLRK